MADEAPTKPTLETLSKQMDELRSQMGELQAEMRSGFANINHMLEQMDIRLDKIEGFANETRSEMMYLRADFKKFRSEFKEPA